MNRCDLISRRLLVAFIELTHSHPGESLHVRHLQVEESFTVQLICTSKNPWRLSCPTFKHLHAMLPVECVLLSYLHLSHCSTHLGTHPQDIKCRATLSMTSAAQQTAFEGSSPSSRPPSRATLRPQSPSQSPFEADGPIRCYDERDPFFALTNSAPYEVQHDGKEYPTAEHLFHAYKFHEDNSHMAEVVRRQPTPQTAREISLLLRPNWRNDWGDVADKCMDAVIEAKFAQHPHLRGLLLSSDTRELVFEEQARGRGDAITTTGEEGGWLGQALTRLRDQLRTKDPEAYSQEPEPADASSNWDRCSSVIDFDRASCLTYWTAAETLSETLPPIYFYDEEEPYYEFTNLSPHPVEFGGKVYANADSLFQYFDTPPTPVASAFSDPELRATWKNESGLSSRQGDTRARLYRHCMDAILEAKFLQHQELYQLLLSTGNSELVYAHPTDHFWGYSEYMSGLNELGKALMRLREKLKAQHSAGQDSERPYCEEDIAQQSADDLSERTSDYTDFEDLSSVNGCPSPIDRPPSAVLVPPREHPASPPRVSVRTLAQQLTEHLKTEDHDSRQVWRQDLPTRTSLSEIPPAAPGNQPPPYDPSPAGPVDALEQVLSQLADLKALLEQEHARSDEVNIRPSARVPPCIHVGLAPLELSASSMDRPSVQMMDLTLRVVMEPTLGAPAIRDVENMTWEEVVGLLRQSPLLEDAGADVSRQRTLSRRSKVRLRAKRDLSGVDSRAVRIWFGDLVQDPDVLRNTRIKCEFLADIITKTDIAIDSLRSLLKAERKSLSLLDIGIMRFPSACRPLYRIYRVQLRAWTERTLSRTGIQSYSSGIEGVYNSCDFRPCREVLDVVGPQIIPQASMELLEMLKPASQARG